MRWSRRIGTSCGCVTSLLCWRCHARHLPTLDRSKYAAASGVARGAYVLADAPAMKPEDHSDCFRK